MKTVLLIVNHDITFYKFRKELAERLVKEHYRVIVVLPVTEETKKIEALGCEVIDVPVERRGTNPAHDFKLFLAYRKILKEIRPDAVLTYTIKPNVSLHGDRTRCGDRRRWIVKKNLPDAV